jgi:hypothetical protein
MSNNLRVSGAVPSGRVTIESDYHVPLKVRFEAYLETAPVYYYTGDRVGQEIEIGISPENSALSKCVVHLPDITRSQKPHPICPRILESQIPTLDLDHLRTALDGDRRYVEAIRVRPVLYADDVFVVYLSEDTVSLQYDFDCGFFGVSDENRLISIGFYTPLFPGFIEKFPNPTGAK